MRSVSGTSPRRLLVVLLSMIIVAGCSQASDGGATEIDVAREELCASVNISASASSVVAGTVAVFTATGGGCTGTPEFRFVRRLLPSDPYTVVQDWSTDNTLDWDTTGATAGNYDVRVHIRDQGSASSERYVTYYKFKVTAETPCSSVSLTPSPTSPIYGGSVATFTAASTGCGGTPEYRFVRSYNDGAYAVVQDWSATASFAWDTTGAAFGRYNLRVFVRNQGAFASYDIYGTVYNYTVLASPCASVGVSASPTSSAVVGDTVTINAAPSGCGGTPEYRYLASYDGGAYSEIQGWTTLNSFNWDTTGFAAGGYYLRVMARNQGSTASYEAYGTLYGYSLSLTSPCTAVSLTASPASSAVKGQLASFTASASGCGGTAEYRFLRRTIGGTYAEVQAWSSSGQFNWETSDATEGGYNVRVFARSQGAAATYEAYNTISYSITAGSANAKLGLQSGRHNSCQLTSAGDVGCWGYGQYGQLGTGNTYEFDPAAVTGLAGIKAIALGRYHACAIESDGAVSCWGQNLRGQIGDGTTTDRSSPTVVPGVTAVAIAAGVAHTCAVETSGQVKCWGYNTRGQVGDGVPATSQPNPQTVSGISTAIAVTVGYYHSCALLLGGTVQCWGGSDFGELGNGTNVVSQLTPVAVTGLSNVVAIHAGDVQTCALTSGGAVYCWGANSTGVLGDNSTTNRNTPVAVTGVNTAVDISMSPNQACAVLADGTVQCWGTNTYGQLGDGTTTQSLTPVAVTGLTGAEHVSAGREHTCAILDDGSIRCWGRNTYYQLGDGTNTQSLVPVTVVAFPSP